MFIPLFLFFFWRVLLIHWWLFRWLLNRSFIWRLLIFDLCFVFLFQVLSRLMSLLFKINPGRLNISVLIRERHRKYARSNKISRPMEQQCRPRVWEDGNSSCFRFSPHCRCRCTCLLPRLFHLMREQGHPGTERELPQWLLYQGVVFCRSWERRVSGWLRCS